MACMKGPDGKGGYIDITADILFLQDTLDRVSGNSFTDEVTAEYVVKQLRLLASRAGLTAEAIARHYLPNFEQKLLNKLRKAGPQ